jgi:hypothetical protein
MKEQEDAEQAIAAALRKLHVRGRIVVNPVNKEAIAEAMAPYPPPWEWEMIRNLTGFTASEMAKRTGERSDRIRAWEMGTGTLRAEQWAEYAIRLTAIRNEVLEGNEAASREADRSRQQQYADHSILAHQEALRSTVLSLEVRLDRNQRPSSSDAALLAVTVGEAARNLKAVERALLRIAAPALRKEVGT